MWKIEVPKRNMHLAAYMKTNGAKLTSVDVERQVYIFTSETSLDEWQEKHNNSCCRRVDLELLGLKRLLMEQ